MLKNNVGNIDRALRIIVGLTLIIATAIGYLGYWGWLGLVPLATGLFKFCPLYRIFGFRTCKTD